MNIKNLLTTTILAAAFVSGSVYAVGDGNPNNTIDGGSDSAAIGSSAFFDVVWADNGVDTTVGLQFDVQYDNTVFSFVGCTFNTPWDGASYFVRLCTDQGTQVQVGLARLPTGPIENGSLTMEFTVDNGPPGTYTFPIPESEVVTTGDNDPTVTTDATVDVLGPAYASAPIAPNAPFIFGSHTAGDPNPVLSTDIDNIGELTTTLSGDCQISGADAGAYILTGGPVLNFDVPEAGPSQNVELACDSANLMPGVYNAAVLTCSHNGGPPGAASPVVHALNCTILDRPRPTYSSTNPMIGGSFEYGKLLTTDMPGTQTMTITNTGNDDMDGLTGSCSLTANPNGAYSITAGSGAYGPLAIGETADVTVQCDSSVVGDHTGGQLTCSAADPASNVGDFNYPLNCVVNAIPTYSSVPAPDGSIELSAVQGNGPGAAVNLAISNTGEAGSVLDGGCSLGAGDGEITFAGATTYSIAAGSSSNVPLQCEGDVGNYSRPVSCTADAPASNAGTFNYTANCVVGQPDLAEYSSSPYMGGNPGDLIDVNEGNPPPPVNNGITPSTVLTISNAADPGDDDLELLGCSYSGDPEITASPATLTTTLAPGAGTNVTFSCATDTTDVTTTFSGTYTCPFNEQPTPPPPTGVEGGSGIMSPATYPVECDVREQYSEVTEDPASGTPQTIELMPNEPHVFSFTFTEVQDENLDAEIACSLASGGDFAITMNGPGPVTVPANDSIQVDVTFTDPGQGEVFTDTLNCFANDNPPPGDAEGEPDFSWPLEVTVIGRNAVFEVTKDFTDDNPMGVEVALDCNTGLPLFQTGTVHDPDAPGLGVGDFTELKMIVVDFEPGELGCEVYETTVPTGYVGTYLGGVDDGTGTAGQTADACTFDDVLSAGFTCEITNTLQEVDLIVNKEWIDDNPGFNLPEWVDIEVRCDNVQDADTDGLTCGVEGNSVCFSQFIDPANPGTFGVLPHWDGSTVCSVTETLESGAEGDVSDCAGVGLAPGQGAECTIVNTRLYEGIPTLSQYGLLLMALMMLGVGLVGFRRYS